MSEVLRNLSDSLVAAVETAGRGVVRIEARRRFNELATFLSGDCIGEQLLVRIVRGGQMQELSVVVGERS